MEPVYTSCRLTYEAYRKSGTRPISAIDWLVLHSTEIKANHDEPVSATNVASAAVVARSFSRTNAEGSSHLVIDDRTCYRCLRNTDVPWAAPYANTRGFHIEQCAFAEWTLAQWMAHDDMLDRVAYKLAYHAHLFNRPLVFVNYLGLRAGRKGVTTHAEVSKAFPNNAGNHSDPGPHYPMQYVLTKSKRFLAEIQNS